MSEPEQHEPPTREDRLFDTAMTLIDKLDKKKASKVSLIVVTIGLVLDILLSAGYVGTQIQNHNTQVTQCQASNLNREQDQDIWNLIFSALEAPDPHAPVKTPAEKAAERQFFGQLTHLVKVKDTPRDCTAVYKFP